METVVAFENKLKVTTVSFITNLYDVRGEIFSVNVIYQIIQLFRATCLRNTRIMAIGMFRFSSIRPL